MTGVEFSSGEGCNYIVWRLALLSFDCFFVIEGEVE